MPEPFNPQSLNRYSYVFNNPIIYIDPSGYGPIVWGGINGGGGNSSGNTITVENYSFYNSSYYYPGYYNYNYNQFRYDPFSESRNSFWNYYGNYSSHSGESGNVVNPAVGQLGNNFGVGINMPVTFTEGNKGWYGGVKSYLKEREMEKIGAGHNVAAFINELGIAAIDTLLPQSIYDVPLMFMPVGKVGKVGKGLVSPGKYFGSKTKAEIESILEKKFGPPRSIRDTARTYYDPRMERSLNVHQDPSHYSGKPHIDVRRRGGYPERKYDLRGE